MVFGVVFYVIYRRFVQGVSITQRVEVPERALHKAVDEAEYETILVPVFGTELDDDIVSTAGGSPTPPMSRAKCRRDSS